VFAIAFDLTVADVERLHPRSVSAAYDDIGRVLSSYGFEWKFPASIRDIRAFRVEQWSDFTAIMKG
jgi:virulence-associated protein VapD